MADISAPALTRIDLTDATAAPATDDREPYYDIMSLLFFAYRDFVRDADVVLESYGFGRAHHRVLHFVELHPGMRVTELLDILRITKQSLGRVLRELVDTGFVKQAEGTSDRRQRLLYTTPQGKALARKLADLQDRRISAAFAGREPEVREQARTFLFAMVDEHDRDKVIALVNEYDTTGRSSRRRELP
jgi:DNA-binding MarR family transcriptional regulator